MNDKGSDRDGTKHDQDKANWALVVWEPLEAMVRVLTHGARKYAPENWRKVPDGRNRYFSAALRHLTAWRSGEDRDPESGEPHLAHAMCNLMFLDALDEATEQVTSDKVSSDELENLLREWLAVYMTKAFQDHQMFDEVAAKTANLLRH